MALPLQFCVLVRSSKKYTLVRILCYECIEHSSAALASQPIVQRSELFLPARLTRSLSASFCLLWNVILSLVAAAMPCRDVLTILASPKAAQTMSISAEFLLMMLLARVQFVVLHILSSLAYFPRDYDFDLKSQ